MDLKVRTTTFKNIQNIEPIVHGGGQEYGLRSGTINLPMAISMVRAIKNAVDQTKSLIYV